MRSAGPVQGCGTVRAQGPGVIGASVAPRVHRAANAAETAAACMVVGHPCTWTESSSAVTRAQTSGGACGDRVAA